MADRQSQTFRCASGVPAESRCLDGHFPGNPIVPGAVILAHLAARLDESGRALERVERIKFRRVLRADTPFEICLTAAAARGRAEFRDEAGVFATASIVLRAGNG